MSTDPRLLGTRAVLEYGTGDFGQGEDHQQQLLEAMRLATPGPSNECAYPAIVIPLVAYIAGEDARFEVADAAAAAVLSSPSATPRIAMLARAGLALLAVQQGDVPAAAEQYVALESGRGTMVPGSIVGIDRLLGLLAQTMGKFEDAVEHFEDALSFCDRTGLRPEYAWSAYDYANALVQSSPTRSRRARLDAWGRASLLLEESLAIAGG